MTNAQIRIKLDQLAALANELDAEAKRRYGPEGMLFFEAEGGFYLMDGDETHDTATSSQRQKRIKFSSQIVCRMGAGAW